METNVIDNENKEIDMAFKHDAVLGRSDVLKLDPRLINVRPGWNPRREFGGPEDESLRDSIKANGVINPVRVRKGPDGALYLIDGERRLRATLAAIGDGVDIKSIPAIVERSTISDAEAMYCAIVTNTGRALSELEQADAFRRLMAWGQSVDDIATRMGRSSKWVQQRLTLVDASPAVTAAVAQGDLPVHTAAKIVRQSAGDADAQADGVAQERMEREAEKAYKKSTPKELRQLDKIDEILTDLVAAGGLPEKHLDSAKEVLQRIIASATWLLDGGEVTQ